MRMSFLLNHFHDGKGFKRMTKILRTNNTSGFRGVSLHKKTNRWHAYASINKRQVHIGYFETSERAHEARRKFLEAVQEDRGGKSVELQGLAL